MIKFVQLDKAEKDFWLPKLFDLLFENMQSIAPSGLSYEQQKDEWISNVSPALDKEPRQVSMCFDEEDLVGYIQYYTREQMLMVEEIQLHSSYHRTMLFYRFCKHLAAVLPENIEYVEAYADRRNLNSQRIMRKLGMEITECGENSQFVHLRGLVEPIRDFFRM